MQSDGFNCALSPVVYGDIAYKYIHLYVLKIMATMMTPQWEICVDIVGVSI